MLNWKADGKHCFWWLYALVLAFSAIFHFISILKKYLKKEGDKLKLWMELVAVLLVTSAEGAELWG